jgi:large subunit ribosomal protein L24
MAQHIRKGDLVMVIAGDDRHKANPVGRVLRVLPKRGKVVVEGVNVCKKHVKPNQKNPQGGIVEKEMPVALSNVMPVVDGKPSRVRFQVRPDGAKVRVAAKNGQAIGAELRKAGR